MHSIVRTHSGRLIAIVALTLTLSAYLGIAAQADEPLAARTVAVTGVIKPFAQTDLYAAITGTLLECQYDLGERVKKNDLLVQVYAPDLQVELRLKQALVLQAKAGLISAKETALAKKAAIDRAKAQSEETSAGIQQADLALEKARAEHARALKLAEKGKLDGVTLDELLRQVKIGELVVVQARARFLAAQAGLIEASAIFKKAEGDVLWANANVEIAKANVERAKAVVDLRDVVAPFDGVIVHSTAVSGARVGPPKDSQAKPLFVVARTDVLRVVVDVPEIDALSVFREARAVVHFPALEGKEFAATVSRTAGALDPKTRTLSVEIDLANHDGKLLPGMFAKVDLTLQTEKSKKKGKH